MLELLYFRKRRIHKKEAGRARLKLVSRDPLRGTRLSPVRTSLIKLSKVLMFYLRGPAETVKLGEVHPCQDQILAICAASKWKRPLFKILFEARLRRKAKFNGTIKQTLFAKTWLP